MVDGDLGHEIDAREIPPRANEGECYHLNPALVDWAFQLTKGVALDDDEAMRNGREQFEQPNARRPHLCSRAIPFPP